MKYLQKTLSALLALLMFLQLGFADAVTVSAEEADVQVTTGKKYSAESDTTDEELFGRYALQMFYGSNVSFFGSAAGEKLTGDEKVLYDALVPLIRQIANGERASTTIAVGQTVTAGGVTYVVDVEAEFSGTTVTDSMINRVLDALLADLPYEMYWHDKVSGCEMYEISGPALVQVGFQFAVAANYRGADAYTADTAKTGAAKAAAANAQAVIDQYAMATDYEKLVGYRDAICSRVEYDYAAAAGGYFTADIDPWQLISVFDGDSSTNVVCEGYSKAFMYLCDMTAFSGDVACYTVDGYMDGGAHMWNVVEIEGKHYLADVTNSDSGTVGMDGSLFLAGGTGSAAGGYTVAGESYVYGNDTQSLWGTGENSILTLEPTGYTPDGGHSTVIDSGACGENLTWKLTEDGTLTISGEGAMKNYLERKYNYWYGYREQITTVVITEGVTSIGNFAFSDCSSMTSVTIPEGITSIGEYAFDGCSSLTNITLPEGLTSIGLNAFDECSGLVDIVIPESVSSIDKFAFFRCSSLTGITIPEGVTSIRRYVFGDCSSLTSVTLPESLTSIDDCAFAGCSSLSNLAIPDGVTWIGDSTFDECSSLTSIILPDGMTSIGPAAFWKCSSLTSITIPESLTSIGNSAFFGCSSLEDVYYGGTEEQWNAVDGDDPYPDHPNADRIHYSCENSTGHWTIDSKDATCEEAGYTCEICSCEVPYERNKQVTSAAGHKYEKEVVDAKYLVSEATCTKLAVYNKSCICGVKGTEIFEYGELKDHEYIPVVTSPTCTQKGYTTHTCSVCGDSYVADEVAAPGHTKVIDPAIAPTEDKPGKTEGSHCSECGAILKAQEEIPTLGHIHNPVTDPVVTATCSTAGKTEGSHCETCGAVIVAQEEIPATGHDWTAATCTTPKTCSVCKVTEGKATGHVYDDDVDGTCNVCGIHREETEDRTVMHMFRMYDPNVGEHFYTGSEEERDNLIAAGWNYEGVGFTFSRTTGAPVYRLWDTVTGEHLYTMAELVYLNEKDSEYGLDKVMCEGKLWLLEGVAFNSAYDTEVPQYRLHNPNATRGAYHFTASEVERDNLIAAGWEYQGIGFYSSWK